MHLLVPSPEPLTSEGTEKEDMAAACVELRLRILARVVLQEK